MLLIDAWPISGLKTPIPGPNRKVIPISFNLTRKTDYALVALSALAEAAGDDVPPMSAREISEKHSLPLPLLMNVLKDLHKADLVTSRRGAGGGYLLTRTPGSISLLQIVEATEGPVSVAVCCDEEEPEPCTPCRVEDNCPIVTPMQRFNDMVNTFLASITLNDLIKQDPSQRMVQLGVQV
ncbi:MAG: RrF2 family transcriptional regulator [Planctomycetota bacterium]